MRIRTSKVFSSGHRNAHVIIILEIDPIELTTSASPTVINVAAQQPVLHTGHPPRLFALTQSCHLQYLSLTLSILNVLVVWRNLLLLISLLHLHIPKCLIQCTASGSPVSSQSSTKRVCRYVRPFGNPVFNWPFFRSESG